MYFIYLFFFLFFFFLLNNISVVKLISRCQRKQLSYIQYDSHIFFMYLYFNLRFFFMKIINILVTYIPNRTSMHLHPIYRCHFVEQFYKQKIISAGYSNDLRTHTITSETISCDHKFFSQYKKLLKEGQHNSNVFCQYNTLMTKYLNSHRFYPLRPETSVFLVINQEKSS